MPPVLDRYLLLRPACDPGRIEDPDGPSINQSQHADLLAFEHFLDEDRVAGITKVLSHMIVSIAASAVPVLRQTMTPLPAASPVALTTHGSSR